MKFGFLKVLFCFFLIGLVVFFDVDYIFFYFLVCILSDFILGSKCQCYYNKVGLVILEMDFDKLLEEIIVGCGVE